QYLLLSVPAGLLAARGIAALAPAWSGFAPELRLGERQAALLVAPLLWVAGPPVPPAARFVTPAHHRPRATASERRAYQDRVSHGGGYPKITGDLAPLSGPDTRPGGIWVLGNPLYYWLSGREQAVARNGASFIEFLPRAEWDSLAVSLANARP